VIALCRARRAETE